MSSVFKTSSKLLREAEVLQKAARVSPGRCLIFLKIAYERFTDLAVNDLVIAAERYFDYLKNRSKPSNLNLIQSQLYSLMLAYL